MHPQREYSYHPYNMYHTSVAEPAKYQEWNWDAEHYEHYGQSEQHFHYLSNFNREREQCNYSKYQTKHFFKVEQPKVDFNRTEQWQTDNSSYPPIPKLKIKSIFAHEMTGINRGLSRGRPRGVRANSYTNGSKFSTRGGHGPGRIHYPSPNNLHEGYRGRGRPRGRPRSRGAQKHCQSQHHSKFLPEHSLNASNKETVERNNSLLYKASTESDILQENVVVSNSSEPENASNSALDVCFDALQKRIGHTSDALQHTLVPNFTKSECLCINLKEYGIDNSKSDVVLKRKFPNMFAKSLQIVLNRLENENTNRKPNKVAVLKTCHPVCPETPRTFLTSQNTSFEEPPVADSPDTFNLTATTVIDTAAHGLLDHTPEIQQIFASSKIAYKEDAEPISSKIQSLVSDPHHKITALDISKLKSKLRNVKYPECFTAQTQTDNTLIINSNEEEKGIKNSDSSIDEPNVCENNIPILQKEENVVESCCSNDLDSDLPTLSMTIPLECINMNSNVSCGSDSSVVKLTLESKQKQDVNSEPAAPYLSNNLGIGSSCEPSKTLDYHTITESDKNSKDTYMTQTMHLVSNDDLGSSNATEEGKSNTQCEILEKDADINEPMERDTTQNCNTTAIDLEEAREIVKSTKEIDMSCRGNNAEDRLTENAINEICEESDSATQVQTKNDVQRDIDDNQTGYVAENSSSIGISCAEIECETIVDKVDRKSEVGQMTRENDLTSLRVPYEEGNYDSDATLRYSDDEDGILEIDVDTINSKVSNASDEKKYKKGDNHISSKPSTESVLTSQDERPVPKEKKANQNIEQDQQNTESDAKSEKVILLPAPVKENNTDISDSLQINELGVESSYAPERNAKAFKKEDKNQSDTSEMKSQISTAQSIATSKEKRTNKKKKPVIKEHNDVEELTLFISTTPKQLPARRQRRVPVKFELLKKDSNSDKEKASRKKNKTLTQKKRTGTKARPKRPDLAAKEHNEIKNTLKAKLMKHANKDDEDDDLPTILPPKRRRISAANRKGSDSKEEGMERLCQEFPRHNWLENKYKEGNEDDKMAEIEPNIPKIEKMKKIVSRKKEIKPGKRRKNGTVTNKRKLISENITMDTEVTTTTVDEQQGSERKEEKHKSCSIDSEVQTAEFEHQHDSETPDSNHSTEENVTKIGEEKDKLIVIEELPDSLKTTSNMDYTPLDLCIKRDKDDTSTDDPSSGNDEMLSKQTDSILSAEKSTEEDLASETNSFVAKHHTNKDNEFDKTLGKSILGHGERIYGVLDDDTTTVNLRDTNSAPPETSNKPDAPRRDSHSLPSFHYSSSTLSETKPTKDVSKQEKSIDSIIASKSVSPDLTKNVVPDSNECLDLSRNIQNDPSKTTSHNITKPCVEEKPVEAQKDYIKHLREFREMEIAEAKMAQEREELLRLKHEKAKLLKQLGSQWLQKAPNGGYNEATRPIQNYVNTSKCEVRRTSNSNHISTENRARIPGKISLAFLKQRQEQIKLRKAQIAKAVLDTTNQNPPLAHKKTKENYVTLVHRMEKGKIEVSTAIEASCPFRKRKHPILAPPFEAAVTPISSRKIQKAHSQSPFQSAGSLIYPLPSFVDQKSELCRQSSGNKNHSRELNRSSSAPSIHTYTQKPQHDVLRANTSNSSTVITASQGTVSSSKLFQGQMNGSHVGTSSTENKNTPFQIKDNSNIIDLSNESPIQRIPKTTEVEIQKELNAAVARRQRIDRIQNTNAEPNVTVDRYQNFSQQDTDRRETFINKIPNNNLIQKNIAQQLSTNSHGQHRQPRSMSLPRQMHPIYTSQTIVSPTNVNPSIQSQLASRLRAPNTTSGYSPGYSQVSQQYQQQHFPAQQHFQQPTQPQSQPKAPYDIRTQNTTPPQRILVGTKTIPPVASNSQSRYIQQGQTQDTSGNISGNFPARNQNDNMMRSGRKMPYPVQHRMRYPMKNPGLAMTMRVPRPVYSDTGQNHPNLQQAKLHHMQYREQSPAHQPIAASSGLSNSNHVSESEVITGMIVQGNVGHNGQLAAVHADGMMVPQLIQSNVQQPAVTQPPAYPIHSHPTNNMQASNTIQKEMPSLGQYMSRAVQQTSVQHNVTMPEMPPNGHGHGNQLKHIRSPTGNMVVGTSLMPQASGMPCQVNNTIGQSIPTQTTIPVIQTVNPPQLQQASCNCVLCGKFAMFLCSNCQKIWYCSQACQLNHWVTHAQECKSVSSEG